MKILFVISEGIGNITQTIPLYLCIKELHEVDVAYIKRYPTDSANKAFHFPAEVDEILPWELEGISGNYDRVIEPPFSGVEDIMLETDSEYKRNMNILDTLGIKKELKRDLILDASPYEGDVVIHNGAVKGWERKKYPFFEEVVARLADEGLKVTSIGSPEEYIKGAINGTGSNLRRTCGTIHNHKLYVGTDTGTYHIAGLMEKPGLVLFTATSRDKNWDKDFHNSIEKLNTWLPCQPCQKWYHFKPEWGQCKDHLCQRLNPELVTRSILSRISCL